MNAIERPTVDAVAPHLGLTPRRRGRLDPCPACGGTEKRGAVVYSGHRWQCVKCKEKGDSINLVSFAVAGQKRAYPQAFAWLRERNQIEPLPTHAPPPARPRAPREEIAALLRAATPAARTQDPRVLRWLASRPTPLDPSLVPAAVLPPSSHPVYRSLSWVEHDDRRAPWWPRRWADTYPLVVPAWTGHGHLAGLHARNVDPNPARKSTWPLGVDCRGLLFADPHKARPLLKGAPPPGVSAALFVEGLPDYLNACQRAARIPWLAVFGIEAGSATALHLVRWPRGEFRFFVATDPDPAGRAYADAIAHELAPRPVYPLPLERLQRLAA